MPFSPLCCESEAILSKKFSFRLPGLDVHTGKFSAGGSPRDLGPGFWYEHIEISTNGSFLEWGILSSCVYKLPVEDVSVSGNVKNMRKNFLVLAVNFLSRSKLCIRLAEETNYSYCSTTTKIASWCCMHKNKLSKTIWLGMCINVILRFVLWSPLFSWLSLFLHAGKI